MPNTPLQFDPLLLDLEDDVSPPDYSKPPTRGGQDTVALIDPTPAVIFDVIVELIGRDDVRSVSCPFDDPAIWRALVTRQVERARATGLPLQEAFALCGPDSGLNQVPFREWGGEIHIPYEGACGGDLFILPSWHRFFADKVKMGANLRWATHKRCHHVLLRGDYGELACATRTVFGDWTLYTSTAPYESCNPFILDPETEALIKKNAARS